MRPLGPFRLVNDDVARDAFERDRPDSPEPDIFIRSVRDDILVHEDLSLFSVRGETLQPLAGCIRSPASSSNATRQLPGGNASGTFTDLLLLLVAMSIPQGLVQRHRLGDALEIELAHLATWNPSGSTPRTRSSPTKTWFAARLRGDARRDVHCAAEVVALVVDHRPGVHAHVGRRKACRADSVDDLERGAHRVAADHWKWKWTPSPSILTTAPRCSRRDLVDQLGELERHAAPRPSSPASSVSLV